MADILTRAEVLKHLGVASSATESDIALIESIRKQVESSIKKYLGYDPVTPGSDIVQYFPQMAPPDNRVPTGDYGLVGIGVAQVAGPETIQLLPLPVRAITEVRVDRDGAFGQLSGSFGSDSIWTAGEQYMLDIDTPAGISECGILRSATATRFPAAPGSVMVTYSAGYTAEELQGQASNNIDASAITLAAKMAMSFFYLRAKQLASGVVGTIKSERIGDYSYTVDTESLSDDTDVQMNSAGLPSTAVGLLRPFRYTQYF